MSGRNWNRIRLPHAKPCVGLDLPLGLFPVWMANGGAAVALVIHNHFEVRWKLRASLNERVPDYISSGDAVQLHISQHINDAVQFISGGSRQECGTGPRGRNFASSDDAFLGRSD